MARTKLEGRTKRRFRIRRKLSGGPKRPRLSIFKSNIHIYAQLIDDLSGKTIACASSLDKQFKGDKEMAKIKGAVKVGSLIAERALSKGVKEIVFDRGGYAYHGRVKALADAAREKGLVF